MQRRRLGGLEVSAVGLGCATMTPFYDEPDFAAAVDTLQRARARSASIFLTPRTLTARAKTRS